MRIPSNINAGIKSATSRATNTMRAISDTSDAFREIQNGINTARSGMPNFPGATIPPEFNQAVERVNNVIGNTTSKVGDATDTVASKLNREL